jgi:formylglycine-generating enzyme required for sulfatase activity
MGGLGRAVLVAALLLVGLLSGGPAGAAEHPEREFRDCSDCPVMVAVPAGRFTMGSPPGEEGRFDSEGPQHAVAVRAFALGKYDVTSEEFLAFLKATGYQPAPCDAERGLFWRSPGKGLAYPPGGGVAPPRWPAVCLSWNDAQAYIAWLNSRVRDRGEVGGAYRLPSEAEWEYAARAGSTAARWWGEGIGEAQANCAGCGSQWDGRELAPVDAFAANPFGLVGMLGNIWRWTGDCWNESYAGAPADGRPWLTGDCSRRVLRGGSWSNLPVFVRAAARGRALAAGGDYDYSRYTGFRLARTLPSAQ